MAIYIREAHADDEWDLQMNDWQNVCYKQPKSLEERLEIAADFRDRFSFTIPMLVDSMNDAAMKAYSAWPERLWVIGTDGRIAYRGEPGPWKFGPGKLEKWLEENVRSDRDGRTRRDHASAHPTRGAGQAAFGVESSSSD